MLRKSAEEFCLSAPLINGGSLLIWFTATSENETTFTGFDKSGATTQTTFIFIKSELRKRFLTSFKVKNKTNSRLVCEIKLCCISTRPVCWQYCMKKRPKIRTKMAHFQQWREEIKVCTVGWLSGHNQLRGLLIYTFHEIIQVRGIPLPIWLGRTREGGVFMEAEPRQKKNKKGQ